MQLPLSIDLADQDLPWRPTEAEGVSWLPLSIPGQGDRALEARIGGDTTVLIRMEPGRGYPAHRHGGIEEVFILAGGYRDADGEHLAVSYLRYPAGSEHAPVALGDPARAAAPDNPACILFAVARGGIELLG